MSSTARDSYALHVDKYAINMMYAHWKHGTHGQQVVFEFFFRRLPFQNGFAVFAGLERVVHYIEELSFTEEDLTFLREQEEQYDDAFLEALKAFKFTGNLYSVREGEIIFPTEPLMRIQTSIFEALLIEAALLNFVNFQSLVATKAARIKQMAHGDGLLEFGTRRAQEADAAIWGARSSYIAGFDATSNVRAAKLFGLPSKGTHSHAWVQNHDTELEAFRSFAEVFPDQTILLVDTYDTIRSGLPNAITVGKELESRGHRLRGVRIDSGDLSYLSNVARQMLDDAGLNYVQVVASSDIDENIIADMKLQGADVDVWGIGTKLITASDDPAFGGVYKITARYDQGWQPVIKISDNVEKITLPGVKEVFRIVDLETEKAVGDYIALAGERIQGTLEMRHPLHIHKKKIIKHYRAVSLLQTIIQAGKTVYKLPPIDEIREYHRSQLGFFWKEHLRRVNPHDYAVSLSPELWGLRMDLIKAHKSQDESEQGGKL